MSKFLGPIHYWLHSKIALQEEIEVSLEQKLMAAGFDLSAAEKWNEIYGSPDPTESLEDVINQDNIHGWLQKRIGFAETRFAGKVTQLKAQYGDEILTHAVEVYSEKGSAAARQINVEDRWDESLQGAHKLLHDCILEGMPCDHAGATTINEENIFQWKSERCLHTGYWQAVDGNPADHYLMRDAFNSAFMKQLGDIEYQRVNEQGTTYYQINR